MKISKNLILRTNFYGLYSNFATLYYNLVGRAYLVLTFDPDLHR